MSRRPDSVIDAIRMANSTPNRLDAVSGHHVLEIDNNAAEHSAASASNKKPKERTRWNPDNQRHKELTTTNTML